MLRKHELINLAARRNLKVMVDHTFLFTGAVKKIQQLIEAGTLGKLYYYDSTRVNLGLFQHDVKRDLGSCSPRSFDHRLPYRGNSRRHCGYWPVPPERL